MSKFKFNQKEIFFCIFIFSIGIFTRLPLVEGMMSHTDASSYVLTLTQFNLSHETPAPPGNPIYFGMGYLLNFFIQDPYKTLILISVLFSGICAVAFYFAGKSIGGTKTGIISTFLYLSASTYYFFGITVYPYMAVITALVFLVWCANEIIVKKKNYGIFLAFIYTFLIGLRPQEVLTTLPLFLLCIYYLSRKEKIKAIILFGLITTIWLFIFVYVSGGLENYLNLFRVSASEGLPPPSLTVFINKRFELINYFVLTIGVGIFIFILYFMTLIYKLFQKTIEIDRRKLIFILFWIVPVILFNFFVRADHANYQALYLIFFVIMVAYSIVKLFKDNVSIALVTSGLIIINLYLFFYNRDPYFQKPYRQSSAHYTDLRRNEYELSNKISYIKRNFNPEESLIIAGPYFWRHARYYLPDYQIYVIHALTDNTSYKNVRVDAKNLLFQRYRINDNYFLIKSPIKQIILFDNEFDKFIDNPKNIKQFKGISKLVIIPVIPNQILKYGFERIEITHE